MFTRLPVVTFISFIHNYGVISRFTSTCSSIASSAWANTFCPVSAVLSCVTILAKNSVIPLGNYYLPVLSACSASTFTVQASMSSTFLISSSKLFFSKEMLLLSLLVHSLFFTCRCNNAWLQTLIPNQNGIALSNVNTSLFISIISFML